MQTHDDSSHQRAEFLRRLRGRAHKMARDNASEITAGKENEEPLAEWKAHRVHVTHLPDDEQGILRISVGGCDEPLEMNYCVFRGDLGRCIFLLERAAKALRKAP